MINNKNKFIQLLLLLVLMLFLTACSYELSTKVIGEGKVDVSPRQECYQKGSKVKLIAEPKQGWRFDHWQGDIKGDNSEVTIIMNGNKEIEASFINLEEKIITFDDKIVEKVVREKINKLSGEIRVRDVKEITTLQLKNIKSIKGIEYLNNLKELSISYMI